MNQKNSLYFKYLSVTYLIISLFLGQHFLNLQTFWLPFETLFFELIFVFINLFFSLFILSIVINFFKKRRKNQQRPQLEIQLHFVNFLAFGCWCLLIAKALWSSIDILFLKNPWNLFNGQQQLLTNSFLNGLLILQFSLVIYLLIWLIFCLTITLILKKTKNLEIRLLKIEPEFSPSCFQLNTFFGEIITDQTWILTFSITFMFFKNLNCYRWFAFLLQDLKLKALKTAALKSQKKEMKPPLILTTSQ